MRIDTQMRTLNDPKQVAKFQEALQKLQEENNKKLKYFTAEEVERSKNFNKLQKDVLERQTLSEIDTSVLVDDSETTFPAFLPLGGLGEYT